MADLSAVLRKTIDGLPKATPSMRGKVYEKARAAISRQIEAANPPLADEVVAARRHALEDAISRTELHYAAVEAAGGTAPAAPSVEPPPPRVEAPPVAEPAPPPPVPRAEPRAPAPFARVEPEAPRMAPPVPRENAAPSPQAEPAAGRSVPVPPQPPKAPQTEAKPLGRAPDPVRTEPRLGEVRSTPPVLPVGIEPRVGPEAIDTPFATGSGETAGRRAPARLDPPRIEATEPEIGLDEGAIPAADLRGPRQPTGTRRAKAPSSKNRTPVFAGLAVLLFVGAGTAAFVYLDDIRSALNIGGSTVASTGTGTSTATAPATTGGEATGEGETATTSPAEGTAAATPPPKRRFTQRLLPDGTEVDEGPAPAVANAFDEGTNVAAASPPSAETQPSAMSPTPDATTGTTSQTPETPPAAATPPAAETAAVQTPPVGNATVPAVAQKAVFYEERSETEAGTQRGGNVVWSVVSEAPAEGQPPEPAIRAVADIPEENLRLTMTIRRNTDATLPASHVIELMFDTPANFAGGSIANVQRLALKPTEQARGEPLIGVAGKISDGFFIIALNNLSEAANANIDLLSREQWIDIPIAYSTGRRALMSIEKGVPGDRVFKEAIDAWAGKT